MKLKRSLYGLRQSSQKWFGTIDHSLADIEFVPPRSDPCVYVYRSNDSMVMLLLYADDVLAIGSNTELLQRLKEALPKRFAVKDMGNILGVQITRHQAEGKLK